VLISLPCGATWLMDSIHRGLHGLPTRFTQIGVTRASLERVMTIAPPNRHLTTPTSKLIK